MCPIVRIVAVARRQAKLLTIRVTAEAEDGAVGISEIGRDLINFQNLAVGQARVAKRGDVAGADRRRIAALLTRNPAAIGAGLRVSRAA